MNIMLMILLFLIMPGSGHGQCSNTNTTFQKNQGILLDFLIKNTPLHNGFYNASVGNNSDQVYGVSQCKANIYSNVCANCLKLSFSSVNRCSESEEMETIFSFCTTKISNKNIFGVWSKFLTAAYGNHGLEDPLVFSKGFSMMQDLASTVPYQPLMYQAAVIDVGVDGKRYGQAQCARDLSKLDCENCLKDLSQEYGWYVKNRTGWEILGSSCSMWYYNVSDTYKNLNVSVAAITPPWKTLPSYGQVPSGATLPAGSQVPLGTTSVTSGFQRGNGGISIGNNIWISTFTIVLLAIQVFHLS